MAGKIQYQVGFKTNLNGLKQLKASLQEIQQLSVKDLMKINNSDVAAAQNAFLKIKQEVLNVEKAIAQAFNTKLNTVNIETFNKSLKNSHTSIQQVYKTFQSAGTAGENAFRKLSSQVLSTNIQLKESHNLLNKMATTFANTIKWQAASSVINGMSRSIQEAWGYAKSLDTSLNNIRIVTNKSAEEMGKFAEQANSAAQNLGKTTTDYTNAALIYAQQGLSDKEIEERAKITLKTANVTGQSTDEVSEQLTAVWNGYKVNAEEAQLYIDRLAAVAATTASDLEELSTGMSKVASAAAMMGVSEEQLAAQLSTMISATRESPETIGTSLRTIFARISDIKAGIDEEGTTLGNYTKKMAQLGFNVLDANGHLRDMGVVLEEIGGKWENLTREQQVSLAQTMAGQRQYSRLMALFDNFDKYEKALNTAQNAAGTLQEQQDIYMESTAAHLETLKAATENIYDSLVDTDSINSLVDGLATAANFMASFIDSIGGGGNLLRSLGAIGVTVFSEQIAKGINTTITNLEIGKENVRQFDQALQTTKEWQGIPGLDKTSQELLKNREQLLELSRLMTPEQFSGMQTLLNDITQVGNEIAQLEDEQSFLNKAIEDVLKYSDAWQTAEQVMASDEGQAEVIQRLQQQEQGIQNIIKTINQYSKLQNKMNTKMINGEQISSELEQARTSVKSYYSELEKLGSLGQLSERHVQSLERIKQELSTLDDAIDEPTMAAKIQLIVSELRGIAIATGQSMISTRQKIESEMGGAADSITNIVAEKQTQLQSMVSQFVSGQEKMQRAANIENYAKMAGGIAQVGSAIQQIQNLGSIWKNADLSTGQKLLQTITNLAMSLPMLINGFTKATTALGLMRTMTTAEAVQAGISTTAQSAHAFSIGLVGQEAGKAAIKVQLLNTTLMINPFVAIAAAVIALVSALGALIKAQDQARKAAIELDKAQIEEENSKQEQIQSNRELCNSLDELNEKYKNGEVSRLELKSAVQDLIDQYGLEGKAADDLANSYDNLAEYIKKVREEMATTGQASARRELGAASDEVVKSIKDNGGREFYGGNGQVSKMQIANFNQGFSILDEPQIIRNLMQQNDIQNGVTLDFGYTAADIVEVYDKVQGVVDQIQSLDESVLSTSARNASEYYTSMVKWLDGMSESVEHYKAAQQDLKKYSAEVAAINIDLSNVQNINEYYEKRKQLIQEIQKELDKNNDKTANAEAMADAHLANNARKIYSAYDDAAKFLDKFKGENETVMQAFSNLDEQHMLAVMDAAQYTTDWNQLADIIERIGNADLSNVGNVFGKDLDAIKTAASQTYNTLQSLYDKIEKNQNLSSEEFQGLSNQLKQFFGQTADSTYKMTGDFVEFANKVNNLKFDGFKRNIAQLINSRDGLLNLQKEQSIAERKNLTPINPDQLGDENVGVAETIGTLTDTGPTQAIVGYTKEINQQRLHYLELVNQGNIAEQDQIQAWKEKNAQGQLTLQQQQQILTKVQELDDATKDLTIEKLNQEIFENEMAIARSVDSFKELKQLAEEGTISDEAFDQAAFEMHQSERMQGLDLNAVDEYGDYLQDLAESEEDAYIGSEKLSEDLIGNAEAADDLAVQIQRMNKGVKALADNWDDWSDVLKHSSKGSDEYYEASENVKDALADLLDVSSDYISLDFVDQLAQNADGMDLMARAAQGDGEAIDQLRQASLEDFIMHLELDDGALQGEELLARITNIQDMLDTMGPITAGAVLDTSGVDAGQADFIQALNDMILEAGMGVDEVNEMLARMGFQGNFASQPQKVTQVITRTNKHHIVTNMKTENGATSWDEEEIVDPPTYEYVDGEVSNFAYQASEPGTTVVPKLESVTKMAGGGANNYSRSNSGGSGGGGKGSGGGGGGGGSGSSPKPDTSQKDRKDDLKDERDIYHDINIELQQIERNLDRTQKIQDRLYGAQLLKNLNKQSAILEQHKKTLQRKNELQKQDLANQRQALSLLGVTFDRYGNIANYMDILAAKQTQVNALIAEENRLIDQYNAETDSDTKKAISERIDTASKRTKDAQEKYKELEEKIGNYDKLREDMEDLLDTIEEETQQQIQIEITKFNMEVEIRLDMGQAERDWNKFRREVLQHTDILKDTNFSSILKDAKLSLADATSYLNVRNSPGAIQTLTNQLLNTRGQIEQINKTGTSDVYGDNKAQALEDYKNYLSQLMSGMEDFESLLDEVDEAYLDTIDDIQDQFDKQIDDFEFVNGLIEHDIELLQLLYGDKNYAAMDKYYTTLEQNNLKQVDSLQKQSQFWQEQWQEALAKGDTQAAEKFKENYKNAINDLNSAIEQSAQNLRDKYANAVEGIFDSLDKKISGGMGTRYLETEWDLINKNADDYLDTVNATFAIQNLQSKYGKAVDEAASIKSQRALNKLMEQQIGYLKDKDKLTQYDVDRAEKLLQIEQARIALEDAQSAKTSMRLKRDAQGNYSYEYVADSAATDDAAQNLAAAQNDLYNFDKNAYQTNLNDQLAIWKEFQERYKEIMLDTSYTEEERTRTLALLQEEYGEYINNKTEENLVIRINFSDSYYQSLNGLYEQNLDNYSWMTDEERNILTTNLEASTEAYKGALGEQLNAFRQYREDYDNIINSDLTEEQKATALDALKEAYSQANITRLDNENIAREGLISAATATAAGYYTKDKDNYVAALSAEKTAFSGKDGLLPTWKSGIAEMSKVTVEEGGFLPVCKTAFDDLKTSTNSYGTSLTKLEEKAKKPLKSVKGGVDNIASAFSTTITKTNDLIRKAEKEMAAIEGIKTKVNKLKTAYSEAYQAAKKAVTQGQRFLQQEQKKAAAAAAKEQQKKNSNNNKSNNKNNNKDTTPTSRTSQKTTTTTNPANRTPKIGDKITYSGSYYYDSYGTAPAGSYYSGVVRGAEIDRIVSSPASGQDYYIHIKSADGKYSDLGWIKKSQITGYDTGGYTGDWANNSGKLAFLHQKELVLNQSDTSNLLDAVKILRTVTSSLGVAMFSRIGEIKNGFANMLNSNSEQLDQNVHIEASFPNVNSKKEIEEAFNDLINLAAQRVMQR